MSLDHQEKTSSKKLAVLTLAALGVVYGDIGTSPLYAIKEIFFSHHHSVAIERTNILGALSLVVWALTIIVTFKYIVYVLRADYGGHGGVFALYALLKKKKLPGVIVVSGLLMLAAGLLFGDGMITPAISVISAVEGLSLITSAFDSYVVPITIAILVLLFLVQKKGTAKIGRIFGPITTIWFIVIGLLGLRYVLLQPEILLSFNPWLAVRFVLELPFKNLLLILGSVMLVIAGGEAMYADLGHFGKQPIRIGWFSLVYPALLLNYLGQGAYLLSGQAVINSNIFFSMVPTFMLIPMVVLATLATIIASQALITGVFSLTAQAISLGLIPWVKVLHTHQDQEGQIYVPIINKALLIGCVLLVLIFRSSSGLASAYGLAVSGDMLVTSIAMILLSKYLWKWSWLKIGGVIIPLLVLESLFLTANSIKLIEGGIIPLLIGLAIMSLMRTWQWGRKRIKTTFENVTKMTVGELIKLRRQAKEFLPKSIVIMTPEPITTLKDKVPVLEQIFWDRYGMLPRDLIFLTVNIRKVAIVRKERYNIIKLFEEKGKGSIIAVQVNFGFMEQPNVEKVLAGIFKRHDINIDDSPENWLVHVMYENILPRKKQRLWKKIKYQLFRFMAKNSETADRIYGLGNRVSLSVEIVPVRF